MAQQEHGDRDLLAGNARYKKLQDLNEGTFGVVMLALDTQAREQARVSSLVVIFESQPFGMSLCCPSADLSLHCAESCLHLQVAIKFLERGAGAWVSPHTCFPRLHPSLSAWRATQLDMQQDTFPSADRC